MGTRKKQKTHKVFFKFHLDFLKIQKFVAEKSNRCPIKRKRYKFFGCVYQIMLLIRIFCLIINLDVYLRFRTQKRVSTNFVTKLHETIMSLSQNTPRCLINHLLHSKTANSWLILIFYSLRFAFSVCVI